MFLVDIDSKKMEGYVGKTLNSTGFMIRRSGVRISPPRLLTDSAYHRQEPVFLDGFLAFGGLTEPEFKGSLVRSNLVRLGQINPFRDTLFRDTLGNGKELTPFILNEDILSVFGQSVSLWQLGGCVFHSGSLLQG